MQPLSWQSKHGDVTGGGSCLGCHNTITWVRRADGSHVSVDLNDEFHIPQCPNRQELKRALRDRRQFIGTQRKKHSNARIHAECWHCKQVVGLQRDGTPRTHVWTQTGRSCPGSQSNEPRRATNAERSAIRESSVRTHRASVSDLLLGYCTDCNLYIGASSGRPIEHNRPDRTACPGTSVTQKPFADEKPNCWIWTRPDVQLKPHQVACWHCGAVVIQTRDGTPQNHRMKGAVPCPGSRSKEPERDRAEQQEDQATFA